MPQSSSEPPRRNHRRGPSDAIPALPVARSACGELAVGFGGPICVPKLRPRRGSVGGGERSVLDDATAAAKATAAVEMVIPLRGHIRGMGSGGKHLWSSCPEVDAGVRWRHWRLPAWARFQRHRKIEGALSSTSCYL